MKQFVITCICALAATQLYAQNTAGKIYYTETVKMNIDLKDADIKIEGAGITADQIAAMMPKEHVNKKVLYYNEEGALYDAAKVENNDATAQQNGMQMMISFSGNDGKAYRDIKNNKLIEQEDFMSRKFLITSDIKNKAWKMTGNQKQILGYPCQEATGMSDTTKLTAWFTSAIPVSAGPKGLGGLPGMILQLEVGKDISIVASKVDATAPDAKLLVKPNEGKKATRAQFDKIVADKVKEMSGDGGDGTNVIIRTIRR